MKTLKHLLLSGLLAAGLAVTALPARADCPDGTVGAPDTITCSGTDTDGSDGKGSGGGTDTWTVDAGATVTNNAYGIAGSGDIQVTNNGTISAPNGPGIDAADTGNIVNNGVIQGATGVQISDGTVVNNNTITAGANEGVVFDPSGTQATMVNNGFVSGVTSGVANNSGAANLDVTNTGTIEAQNVGIASAGTATINNSGLVDGVLDDAVQTKGDAIINNTSTGEIVGGDDGIEVGGVATISNAGNISGYDAGVLMLGGGTVVNDGTIQGSYAIDASSSSTGVTVTNNGTIDASIGYDGIDGSKYDDTVYNNGTITAADNALFLAAGDDTVVLGGGSVGYSTSCGDIAVTNIDAHQATVNGLMNGGVDNDTLVINYFGSDPMGTLDAADGSATVNGSTYNWLNFESLQLHPITYHEGPTRLYDDGVVLAFTSADGNGIDVCSGPNGFRAGTIDFATLDPKALGQTFSAGNAGWFVQVWSVEDGLFQVNVFDGNGQLVSDTFTFRHE